MKAEEEFFIMVCLIMFLSLLLKAMVVMVAQ